MAARPGDRLSPPYGWLSDGALTKLGRRTERLINASGWPFDEFAPEDYVESEGEATLHDFVVDTDPIVREAYVGDDDGGSATFDVVATVEGHGDAHWHVSQLSVGDLDAFSGRVEAEEHGGGILQDVDGDSPCLIDVTAQFVVRGQTWAELDIERVSLAPREIKRRVRQHGEAEIRRLQKLGLLPQDDELDGD